MSYLRKKLKQKHARKSPFVKGDLGDFEALHESPTNPPLQKEGK
jgi:hypothetical protein